MIPVRRTSAVAAALAALTLAASCGSGEAPLASGDGFEITVEDFRSEFESLTPEGQVSVLEQGGRLQLVERMINRRLLLSEAGDAPPEGLDDWLRLSETAWLSRGWLEASLDSMSEAGPDTAEVLRLAGTEVDIRAVLMRDSAAAAGVLARWSSEGPGEPEGGMALAPWTEGDESYLEMGSGLLAFMAGGPALARAALPRAGEGPVLVPLFDAWAVLSVDTASTDLGPDEVDLQQAATYKAMWELAAAGSVRVSSPAVEQVAGMLSVDDGRYVLDLEPDAAGLVLADYAGGELTAGDLERLFEMLVPESFFGGVPEELAHMALPSPMVDPGIDLWMYVSSVSSSMARAEAARESGMEMPDGESLLTVTEHVLRRAVLQPESDVDSTEAIAFYEEQRDMYTVPELRSVLLAYVPAEWAPEGAVDSFDELGDYYTNADSAGNMLPTPLQPREVYGPLADAVFQADTGVIVGPLEVPGTDMLAFLEVVEVMEEGAADPSAILPQLRADARLSAVSERLQDYLMELRESYDVEVDTTAVSRVDPWRSVY